MSTKNLELDIVAILERVGNIIGSHRNKELGSALGVAPQTISMWKHRKTIPTIQLTQFAVDRGVSLEHLLTGIENVDTKNITIYPFRLFYRLRDMMDRPQEYIDALNSAIATNDPIFVSTIMRSMADVIERGNSGQGKQVENAGNSIKDKQP